MANLAALLAAVAALVSVAAGQAAAPDSSTEAARSRMVGAINSFSVDLYKKAGSATEGNVVLSPLSAGLLLALTWMGAGGLTARELGRALHLPQDERVVALGSKALVSSLQTSLKPSQEVILRFANKLYVQSGFRLKEDFRLKASSFFAADAEQLDFARDADGARSAINRWVEQYTADKIKDLFPRGSPSSSSLLILVNAVYLKAIWLHTFDVKQTEMKEFHLSPKSTVKVPTMRKYHDFLFANMADLKATALQLPVEDGRGLKMVIVLPNSVDGLSQLEANLHLLDVNAIAWEKRSVNISLPRFLIEATHNLNVQLQQLGVNDLFTRNANLSGIANEGLFVSKAVQKTFIDVNENGIEAAAATGIDFVYFSIPPPRAEFHADHPFLFFIVKEEVLLFLGRVTNPQQK
ncbi:hypothetical protein R5R35_011616 [Gryllus longicercus]|uniref:Serpin domain-containing protein n=1 Tax=Gryllus longicercus TaxID=2509291 RepID=A0AAN9Z2Y3_9ORTH